MQQIIVHHSTFHPQLVGAILNVVSSEGGLYLCRNQAGTHQFTLDLVFDSFEEVNSYIDTTTDAAQRSLTLISAFIQECEQQVIGALECVFAHEGELYALLYTYAAGHEGAWWNVPYALCQRLDLAAVAGMVA